MSVSTVLEVVLGLSFLYATLSLVASGVNELISSAFSLRARTLEKGLIRLLDDDPAQSAAIYDHPLVQALFRPRRRPSYIPSATFALALLDTKVRPAVGAIGDEVATITTTIAGLPAGRVQRTLDVLWRESKQDAAAFRTAVEGWFNNTMERVSGWYRRLIQIVLLSIGVVVAVGLNVNSVTITQRLWVDAPLRAAVVAQAEKATPPPTTDPKTAIEAGVKTVEGLSLPIGWGKDARPSTWYGALAGWALTAVAISLGAPFWFDVLSKVARVRSSGTRPDSTTPAKPGG